MIRRCDGSDPHLISRHGSGHCSCGLTFDDVERMVIWPHNQVRPRLTVSEIEWLVYGELKSAEIRDVAFGALGSSVL